jgi:hypothetical protein
MEMDLLRDSVEKLDDINLSFEEREKVLSRVNAKNLMPIKVYLFTRFIYYSIYLLLDLFIYSIYLFTRFICYSIYLLLDLFTTRFIYYSTNLFITQFILECI